MVLAVRILETGVAILISPPGSVYSNAPRPRHRRLRFFRRGLRTDVAYLVFTPLITKIVERIVLLLAIVPAALLVYGVVDKDLILGGFGPLGRLPYPLQAVLILAVGDFLGYWMHRAFHEAGCGASTPSITPRSISTGSRRSERTRSTTADTSTGDDLAAVLASGSRPLPSPASPRC